MTSLRGGQDLWVAATVNNGDKSALAEPGPGPYVTIYISNTGANSATFAIECAATSNPKPGRNALDGTADGGLTWFPYTAKHNQNLTPLTLVVAAGTSIALDLSEYGPQFVRLRCTANTGGTTITAFATTFGPN